MGNCSIDTTEKNGKIVLQNTMTIEQTRKKLLEILIAKGSNHSKPQSCLTGKITCQCHALVTFFIQEVQYNHIPSILELAMITNDIHAPFFFSKIGALPKHGTDLLSQHLVCFQKNNTKNCKGRSMNLQTFCHVIGIQNCYL